MDKVTTSYVYLGVVHGAVTIFFVRGEKAVVPPKVLLIGVCRRKKDEDIRLGIDTGGGVYTVQEGRIDISPANEVNIKGFT